MSLATLCPRDMSSELDGGISELLQAILVRTNFVPVVRHVIGWRGLHHTLSGGEAWTAKIKGYAGIFGLRREETQKAEGWWRGRFVLTYFPDPAEALVELCSIRAGAATQRSDYVAFIRNFMRQLEVASLFDIGCIDFHVNWSQDTLELAVDSVTRQQVIALDGIRVARSGQSLELVEPGGYDQDFPSYETALALYEVLAASLTFTLGEPPVSMRFTESAGTQTLYDSTGRFWVRPCEGLLRCRLILRYGSTSSEHLLALGDKDQGCSEICWQAGAQLPARFSQALWWKAHTLSDRRSLDKTALGVDERPALLILTGFLGSGKTSFLQHFIEHQVQRSHFVAVIQNEIGEIGLDGKILDYSVTEIDEGCVCCTLVGSLKQAVRRILTDFQPDHIIVETTGLANPLNLLDEMAELSDLVRFDSVTTVVDAVNALHTLDNQPIAVDQVKAADVLLLNKQDLVDPDLLQRTHQRLRGLNPHAPILTTTKGHVHPALIYEMEDIGRERPDRKNPAGGSRPIGCVSHLDQGLWSHTIRLHRPVAQAVFWDTVAAIPPTVFRAKGVVDLDQPRQTVIFQYVAGRCELSRCHNPGVTDRFLTFIGQAEDRAVSVPLLDRLFAAKRDEEHSCEPL
jgi:G3E family GTPase